MRRGFYLRFLIILLLPAIILTSGCLGGGPPASPEPGGIEGTVTATDDKPAVGMMVSIVSGTTGFPEIAATTNGDGYYAIGSVPPGTFDVAVHDQAGNRVGQESVVVQSGQTSTLNFIIQISASQPQELAPVEVREYEGTDLSSMDDFRENSIKGPQQVDIESYQLQVTGLVESAKSYTYDEVIDNHQNYEKVVTLDCVEGWSVTILWEGILVKDLLAETTPLSNAKVVIFHAHDGYTTSLPLDYIMDNDIIMAYKMNGIALPSERGFPFELVAESKLGYKWIKWITEIELSDDVDYRGYWESRGFSNTADVD